jgi:hypothetical protein
VPALSPPRACQSRVALRLPPHLCIILRATLGCELQKPRAADFSIFFAETGIASGRTGEHGCDMFIATFGNVTIAPAKKK